MKTARPARSRSDPLLIRLRRRVLRVGTQVRGVMDRDRTGQTSSPVGAAEMRLADPRQSPPAGDDYLSQGDPKHELCRRFGGANYAPPAVAPWARISPASSSPGASPGRHDRERFSRNVLIDVLFRTRFVDFKHVLKLRGENLSRSLIENPLGRRRC